MSQEKQPARAQVTKGYVPCGDDVLDTAIMDSMYRYYDTLVNGARTEFREKPVKARLHDVCWQWGQNPDTWADSVRLKAQIFARALTKVALDDCMGRYERKGIPPLDAYWVQVDHDLKDEIRGVSERHAGTYYDYEIDCSRDQETNYLTLAHIGDYSIYRRDLVRSGQSIHIDYLACHALRAVSLV